MILDHTDERYKRKRALIGDDIYNGAYYYSQEIVDNIIPKVKTDRNWITVAFGVGADHSILIVHDNVTFEQSYQYMLQYDDVIWVVSRQDLVERAERYGKTILLPMSVDVQYVKSFSRKKDREVAFCGRRWWRNSAGLNMDGVDCIENLPRTQFLQEMARYRKVYAVGRCAIEAKILGCEVLPFHERFPDPDTIQVLDNSEGAKILQQKLDEIDRR